MKIIASGMSGLVGRHLALELAKEHELVRLVRRNTEDSATAQGREVKWNPEEPGSWAKEIDGADAVINLCGEPIADKRWTELRKRALRNSRIRTTQALVRAIETAVVKPKVLLNASAIGYYGPRDHYLVDEETKAGVGFLTDLCMEWEKEALRAKDYKVRVVLLRTGIILSRDGGALKKMLLPFQFFLGGPLGDGRQYMSWIHIEDEIRAIQTALLDPMMQGPLNLTAPNPVTMDEFAHTLGKVLRRPSCFRVPEFILRTLLGELSEMLLTGQKVYPQKLKRSGFQFRFETLEEALKNLL